MKRLLGSGMGLRNWKENVILTDCGVRELLLRNYMINSVG